MGGVLERVDTDKAHPLSQELIAAQPHCQQIRVPRVPHHRSHMFFLLFLIRKAPDRQHMALILHRVHILACGPVIFVVLILLVIVVEHYHSFHYLQAPLERRRVQRLLLLVVVVHLRVQLDLFF